MYKNYIIIAMRNILKHKGFSIINILGLSIGLTCCMLIYIYIRHETGYDNFYKDNDRIYRVWYENKTNGPLQKSAQNSGRLIDVLQNDYPEVEKAAKAYLYGDYLLQTPEKNFILYGAFTDARFFDIFSYKIIAGNVKDMNTRDKIIISQKTAKLFFGDGDAVGKSITVPEEKQDFIVAGVYEDLPFNTHNRAEFLLSLSSRTWMVNDTSWFNAQAHTYIKFRKGADPKQFENKLQALVTKYIQPIVSQRLGSSLKELREKGFVFNYHIQPITKIYLNSDLSGESGPRGKIEYLYMAAIVAFFILLLACANFINIVTAHSANRAREIGMRKVQGVTRGILVVQFLIESILICAISMIIAIGIAELALPYFNSILGKNYTLQYIFSPMFFLSLIVFVLVVGVMAGSYPAFFMSAFNPIAILKGNLSTGAKGQKFRRVLVLMQFVISLFILSSTLLIYKQLMYMQSKNLGFDKEHVLVITRGKAVPVEKREQFKEELKKYPGFISATFSQTAPGAVFFQGSARLEGSNNDDLHSVTFIDADYDYLGTLGVNMKHGRFFSKEISSDTDAVVINEAAAKEFSLKDPLSKHFDFGNNKAPIIGVIEDYNFESLKIPVGPVVFFYGVPTWAYYCMVRYKPGNIMQTVKQVEEVWNKFTDNQVFEVKFMDDFLNTLYETEILMKRLFSIFAFISIIIAMLGLVGLIAYLTKQRSREIGLRKTLGASKSSIIWLFIREIITLLIIAGLISTPAAYFYFNKWISQFAYQTPISWWVFMLTVCIAILITLLTISLQTYKAARKNPLDTLRYE